LLKNGHEVYLIGGCVRNLLLAKDMKNYSDPKDWDMTTNATPEEMLAIFPTGFYDNTFGTVGIPVEIDHHPAVVEVTTFRTERNYKDSRHPSEVAWGKTIQE